MTPEEHAAEAARYLNGCLSNKAVIARAIRLAVAAEREACAQVADAENDADKDLTHGFWSHCAEHIAAGIRARASA